MHILKIWLVAMVAGMGALLPFDIPTITDEHVVVVAGGGGHGTGVYIARNIVLTNKHVAKAVDIDPVVVRDNGDVCQAEVIWKSKTRDLATVKTKCEGPPVSIACEDLDSGDKIESIGHPGKVFRWAHVYGRASHYQELSGNKALLFTAAVSGGQSGSPVIHRGKLYGLVYAGFGLSIYGRMAPTPFVLAVPSSEICKEKEIMKHV